MEKFSGPLSRRYGTALFELLKELYKNNNQDFSEASNIIEIICKNLDKKVLKSLQEYSLTLKQKQDLFTVFFEALNFAEITQELKALLFKFFMTIIQNKRALYLPSILEFYLKQADEYLGVIRADIVSATSIAEDTLKTLKEKISKSLNKNIMFSTLIDESLRCGFLIKIGSIEIDASLKSFLTKLNEAVR